MCHGIASPGCVGKHPQEGGGIPLDSLDLPSASCPHPKPRQIRSSREQRGEAAAHRRLPATGGPLCRALTLTLPTRVCDCGALPHPGATPPETVAPRTTAGDAPCDPVARGAAAPPLPPRPLRRPPPPPRPRRAPSPRGEGGASTRCAVIPAECACGVETGFVGWRDGDPRRLSPAFCCGNFK